MLREIVEYRVEGYGDDLGTVPTNLGVRRIVGWLYDGLVALPIPYTGPGERYEHVMTGEIRIVLEGKQ